MSRVEMWGQEASLELAPLRMVPPDVIRNGGFKRTPAENEERDCGRPG